MNTLYVGNNTPRRRVCETSPLSLEWVVADASADAGVGVDAIAGKDNPEFQELSKFLKPFGVHVGLAEKIFQHYGPGAVKVITADPFRLADEVGGVGFKTADRIARGLGWPNDAPARLNTGMLYTLRQITTEGHVFAPQPYLLDLAARRLTLDEDVLVPTLKQLLEQKRLHIETLPGCSHPAIYLPSLYRAEMGIAKYLRQMLASGGSRLARCGNITTNADCELSAEQRRAVNMALTSKVCILTGQPGTGKTTALRALIQQLEAHGCCYGLACPTGRAAKRLSEVTGREALTIHRLLGYTPESGFTFNDYQKLLVDMVVIDEASMMDVPLMYALVQALHPSTHLLLVGDVHQLPSVGPGHVLGDLIASGQVPVARLTTIFRQAANSLIITNAQRINQGKMPVFGKGESDFFLFEQADPDTAAAWVPLCQDRIGHSSPII